MRQCSRCHEKADKCTGVSVQMRGDGKTLAPVRATGAHGGTVATCKGKATVRLRGWNSVPQSYLSLSRVLHAPR